jgi:hypothetical protein
MGPDAAKSNTLAPALRSDIAIAAWTRAMLLKNGAIAREMTPVVTELVPELKDDLAEYAKTSDAGSWRYSCTETNEKDAPNYSNDAFEILHTRYPDNDWTKNTPYWFK